MESGTKGKIIHDDAVTDEDLLIFKESDIYSTTDILSRMIRKIFFEKKITNAILSKKHRALMDKMGACSSSINYNWNNLKKAIVRDKITFNMAVYILCNVLDCNIKGLSFKLDDAETGKTTTYKLDT